MATRNLIQVRRGYSMTYSGDQIGSTPLANIWTAGIQLAEGEIGYEIDTGKFKIGKWDPVSNALTTWANLDYAGGENYIPGSGIGIDPNSSGPDTLYSILTNADDDTNITIVTDNIANIITGATGTYHKIGLADNLTNINDITISGALTANTAHLGDIYVSNDVTVTGNLTVNGETISFNSATITLVNLSATSGNFSNDLTVGGVDVSLVGHGHDWSEITDFCEGVGSCVNTEMSGVSGVALTYDSINTILKIGLTGEALAQHQINTNGIIVRTGTATYNTRTLIPGSNIEITDGNGVADNPNIGLVSNVSGLNSLTAGNITLSANKITTSSQDADITIESSGTGTVFIHNASISGSYINNAVIGNVTPASGTFTSIAIDNILIDNNTISRNDSGGDLTIGDANDNVKISGTLYLNGTQITSTASEINYLDIASAGTAEASKALVLDSSSNITSINDLTANNLYANTNIYINSKAVATQEYVDAVKQGLDVKDSVRVLNDGTNNVLTNTGAGTSQLLISTVNSNVVDGVTLVLNDRVLVNLPSSAGKYNGIYYLKTLATVSTQAVLERSTDADEINVNITPGLYTFVTEGTYADSGWILTTDWEASSPPVLNANPLFFTQFSGAGQISAGSGLTKDGNTINIGVSNTLNIAADTIDLATITQSDNTSVNPVSTIITAVTRDNYGRVTGISSGSSSNLTAGKANDLVGGLAGSLPYQDGADSTTFLGIGTAGQVLRVNGGATAPYWDTLTYDEIGNLPTIGTGILTIATNSGAGLSVSATPTFSANENSPKTITISSNATSANNASTIVFRDSGGNFSAGNISGTLFSGPLVGDVTGNLSGVASDADQVYIHVRSSQVGDGGKFYITYTDSAGDAYSDSIIESQLYWTIASGVLNAPYFSGNGTLLTNLNGSNISTGTISIDRLPDIPNTGLVNSSITLGSTIVSLGGTAVGLSGLSYVSGTSLASPTTLYYCVIDGGSP